ncbi:hypothetical protein [Zooshikella harenae]|uniref:Uncharacterized protein n=1 Tax=Zooshikella harenae TaxID=2827238 RepID=A0ABS5ZJW8_9GAMM|nr:hypothetical protein [Zooshikella harenae]MBU2714384.1 hypothetical protein [Zooshikella harenae]
MNNENYALYSQTLSKLPEKEMLNLIHGIKPIISSQDGNILFTYNSGSFSATCILMNQDDIPDHLESFTHYIDYISKAQEVSKDYIDSIKSKILKTTLVLSINTIYNDEDEPIAEDLIGKLCFGLNPIVFFNDSLYDQNSKLILAPNKPLK